MSGDADKQLGDANPGDVVEVRGLAVVVVAGRVCLHPWMHPDTPDSQAALLLCWLYSICCDACLKHACRTFDGAAATGCSCSCGPHLTKVACLRWFARSAH
jgi:hypothetical protein